MKPSLSFFGIICAVLLLISSCATSPDPESPDIAKKDTIAIPKPVVKVPAIERMYQRIDTAGHLAYFYGRNFSKVASENLFIFNGDSATASIVHDSLETQWTAIVKIPPKAVSGQIRIKVNGILSEPFKDTLYIGVKREWKEMAPFPGKGRIAAASFAINGKGYVLGGIAQDPNINFQDCYQYDPKLDKWTRMPDYPGTGTSYSYVFVIGDKAYVGGGIWRGTARPDLYEFNTTNRTWTKKANSPFPVYISTATAFGQQGYVFDCDKGTVLNYDPQTDVWTKKGFVNFSYGSNGNRHASFVLNNRLYFGFGYGDQYYERLVVYDLASNSWKSDPIGNLVLGGPRAVNNVEVYGQKIYISIEDMGRLQEYDSLTDKSKAFIDTSFGFSNGMSFLIGSEYFVTGGQHNVNRDVTQKLWKIYLEDYKW
jgi:hypothetical protein